MRSALAALAILLLFLAAAVAMLLFSEPGRSVLARIIADRLSVPGMAEVEIERLQGGLPGRVRIGAITVSDGSGAWMTIRDVEVVWRPLEILAARLRIENARAGEIAIMRRPVPPARPRDGTGPALPSMEIDLAAMRVDALRLAPPVLGQAAELTLAAAATAMRDRASIELNIERIDAVPGRASAALGWNAASGALDIEADLSEPAEGLLARLLGLPGLPPLELSVAGDGPAGDWRGRLELQAGALVGLSSSLSVSVGRDFRLGMQGDVAPGKAMGTVPAAMLGPRSDFDLELSRKADAPVWAVTIRSLTSAAITASGAAGFDATLSQVDGMLELAIVDGRRLAGLTAPLSFAGATAKADFHGPLTYPALRIEAAFAEPAADGFSAGRASLHAELRPDGPLGAANAGIAMSGGLRFDRLATPWPALSGLLGDGPQIAMADARLEDLARFTAASVTISGAKADASLAGRVGIGDGTASISGRIAVGDLSPLSEFLRRPLAGKLETSLSLTRGDDGAVGLDLEGILQDTRLGQAAVERLLGPAVRVSGQMRHVPGGPLSFSGLTVAGRGVTVDAAAALHPGDRLEADYVIDIGDIAALGIAAPDRKTGRLVVSGRAAGPVADPVAEGSLVLSDAAPGGLAVSRLEGRFTMAGLVAAPRGELVLDGKSDLVPDLSGRTEFLLERDRLVLSRLGLAGRGSSLQGNIAIPLDGRPATGDLAVEAADIAPWSGPAGRPLGGGLRGRIGLVADGPRQAVSLDATATGLTVGDGVFAGRTNLSARISDFADARILQGTLTASAVQAGPMDAGGFVLELEGPADDLAGRVHLSGSIRDRTVALDLDGRLRRTGGRTILTVAGLTGTVADIPVLLRQPARIDAGPASAEGDFHLTIGGGAMRGRYGRTGDAVAASLQLESVPLASVWPAAPPQLAKASIAGLARLDGPAGGPKGRLDLSVTGLAAGETREAAQGLELTVGVDIAPGRLSASGRVEGLAGVTANTEITLPFRLSLAPPSLAVNRNGPLSGRVEYRGPVGPGWALLGLDRHRLEGQADVVVDISGSLGAPRVSGQAVLADGRYENLDTGTILSDMQIVARPSESAIAIERASARDGGEGHIAMTGRIDLSNGLPGIDLGAEMRRARLVRRDELTATASGSLRLRGGVDGRTVSGRLAIDEAEIKLPRGLPPGVVEIPVEETGGLTPTAREAAPAPRASQTELDIEVSMPKRVFVRGRGLDSEWGGDLKVTGTTAAPRLQGELRPLRGRYDFAGKVFRLREGSIAFAGRDRIDPALNLSAEREAADLTAVIRVTGTARKPAVALTSQPEYPQDEILSRLLFNKSTGRLTATEALQLAQAVASLAGVSDGGGMLDFARGMLNLDVLRFRGEGADGPAGTEAGKYLSDRVYLGVEGDATGETGVTVEIEISPRLKLESDVGRKDKSQVGLKWKRDY